MVRDVVLQDVVFQNASLKPFTHISFRCDVPIPSLVKGQPTIMFKPHILKHHIPELSKAADEKQSKRKAWPNKRSS